MTSNASPTPSIKTNINQPIKKHKQKKPNKKPIQKQTKKHPPQKQNKNNLFWAYLFHTWL